MVLILFKPLNYLLLVWFGVRLVVEVLPNFNSLSIGKLTPAFLDLERRGGAVRVVGSGIVVSEVVSGIANFTKGCLYRLLSDGEDVELLVYLVEEEKDIDIGVLVLVCHLATYFSYLSRDGERLF